jgi:leucyl/phenylalanyl-tRNA--protein transferase
MALSLPNKTYFVDGLAKLPYPLRQNLFGLAYLLIPRRLPNLPPLLAATLADIALGRTRNMPTAAKARERPDGLCGVAGRMDVADLLEGYARGMFVHSHVGPLKWWAPKYRMVLFFDQARVEKKVRRLLRKGEFQVTADTAFAEVMRACAAPRPGHTPLTWITPRLQALFQKAHDAGHAHSVEAWKDGKLVGGVYGLAVGNLFFTESQFFTVSDASKIAVAVLNRHLQTAGFVLDDGKHPTPYLADSGMRPITREEFTQIAAVHARVPRAPGHWQLDSEILTSEWKPAEAGGVKMADVLPNGSSCPWTAAQLLGEMRSNTW